MGRLIVLVGFLWLAGSFFIWPVASGYAAESYEEMSTEDTLYIRGMISSVSPPDMQIVVRPLKGRRVVIKVELTTEVEGFERIEQLEKKQQVKVWYQVVDEENKAVKIEKLMDLGC